MDTMRDRFAPVVSRLLDEDPRLAVVLAEIGKDGFSEARSRDRSAYA
jgi:transketolase